VRNRCAGGGKNKWGERGHRLIEKGELENRKAMPWDGEEKKEGGKKNFTRFLRELGTLGEGIGYMGKRRA